MRFMVLKDTGQRGRISAQDIHGQIVVLPHQTCEIGVNLRVSTSLYCKRCSWRVSYMSVQRTSLD